MKELKNKEVKEEKQDIVVKKATIQARADFRVVLNKYKKVLSKKVLDASDETVIALLDKVDITGAKNDMEFSSTLLKSEAGREFLKNRVLTPDEEAEYEEATIELVKVVVDFKESKMKLDDILNNYEIEELWQIISSFRGKSKL